MIRLFARFWAKWAFVLQKEIEGSRHELAAKVADRNAALNTKLIAQLTAEADTMDARIKDVAAMEETGYWECESGHEVPKCDLALCDEHEGGQCNECKTGAKTCDCGEPMKLISRATMTGQELYESDKDRRDVEKMLEAKRQEITARQKDLGEQQGTAKYFRGQAQSSRTLADNLRKV